MVYIDEKFKERSPTETVNHIINILNELGIKIKEKWNQSGIDNCWSLIITPETGGPFSNGKGVSKDLARASAYGEFIERLQSGLFYCKYPSIYRFNNIDIQRFSPDVRYMTMQELVDEGEWMDYIIASYGGKLTRESLAQQCKIYSCSDEEKILTVPFYSLFEDKYVYLPMGFVDQMYGTNGCCAGNSRQEAWVHALSEIMERAAALKSLLSGQAAPKLSEELLNQFPVVFKILEQLRDDGNLIVDLFDLSMDNGFPIISTRIIDKRTKKYLVNVAADPVLEIAIERTLTEIMQGRNIKNFSVSGRGEILSDVTKFPMGSNVYNHLETGNGLYAADFFAEELTCNKAASDFADNSNKNNSELLSYMLELYYKLGKPIYVRNFSYLGFPCYRFVVPGFSEALFTRFDQSVTEIALGDYLHTMMLDIKNATDVELKLFIQYNNLNSSIISKYQYYSKLSGIPLTGNDNFLLASVNRAYAFYRLGKFREAINCTQSIINSASQEFATKEYLKCVNFYLDLMDKKVTLEKIRIILNKFFGYEIVNELLESLQAGMSPYDKFLLCCDPQNCKSCKYNASCMLDAFQRLTVSAGSVYSLFTQGQDKSEFKI